MTKNTVTFLGSKCTLVSERVYATAVSCKYWCNLDKRKKKEWLVFLDTQRDVIAISWSTGHDSQKLWFLSKVNLLMKKLYQHVHYMAELCCSGRTDSTAPGTATTFDGHQKKREKQKEKWRSINVNKLQTWNDFI